MLAALSALALAVALLWAYAPILDNGLVWDDGANLISARAMWDRGIVGVAWAFREPFAGHYQPLTWISYQLDAALSGATPRGLHATQIALHLLVTCLVAWLAQVQARTPRLRTFQALQGPWFPLLSAALFSLAPIRVESVAWATERRDLLGAAFALAAAGVYLRTSPADLSPSRGRFAVAALLALSALSRAQMTLPFVLLALDGWPLDRLRSATESRSRALLLLLREKALLLTIAAASATAAIWAQTSSGALTSTTEHGLFERLVQAGYGLAYYPIAALVPHSFGAYLPLHERPAPFPLLAPAYLLPALASVAFLLGVWFWRRRAPALAVACSSYALLVLPVLGLAQSGIQLVADRYAYLATVPLVLLLAGALAQTFGATNRRVTRGAIVLAVLLLVAWSALITRHQTRVWHDDEVLWRHVLAHSESTLADNNLGQLLFARGEAGPALLHLTRALDRSPQYGRPWRALAAILEAPWPADTPRELSKIWVAETLAQAAPYQGGFADAPFASGLAWLGVGETEKAESAFRRALAIDSAHDGARLALVRLEAPRPVTAPAARASL